MGRNHENLSLDSHIPTEIRTEHALNTRLEHYRQTSVISPCMSRDWGYCTARESFRAFLSHNAMLFLCVPRRAESRSSGRKRSKLHNVCWDLWYSVSATSEMRSQLIAVPMLLLLFFLGFYGSLALRDEHGLKMFENRVPNRLWGPRRWVSGEWTKYKPRSFVICICARHHASDYETTHGRNRNACLLWESLLGKCHLRDPDVGEVKL
jgi:hypothetical protein